MTPKSPLQQVADLIGDLGFSGPSDLDLSRVAERLNVEVRYERLDNSAANIIGVGDHAIVTVDQNATLGRQRFSIAHEIGHWIYDRGKGLYLCKTQDLNTPWNSGQKKTDPREKRANRFAAELLMPEDWFRREARGREISFNSVERLRELFDTSRTSTAIRLIELGSSLAMLVMYNEVGRRKWYCHSKELPEQIYPHQTIPQGSQAWVDIVRNNFLVSKIREVDGDQWVDHRRAFDLTITEQAMRVGKNVLVMIGFPDETVISEIQDELNWSD